MVDKQVHDRFGDLVSDGFADDVEVGRDEGADEFGFQSFPLGELGIALGGLRLPVRVKSNDLRTCHSGKGDGDVHIENYSRYSLDLAV